MPSESENVEKVWSMVRNGMDLRKAWEACNKLPGGATSWGNCQRRWNAKQAQQQAQQQQPPQQQPQQQPASQTKKTPAGKGKARAAASASSSSTSAAASSATTYFLMPMIGCYAMYTILYLYMRTALVMVLSSMGVYGCLRGDSAMRIIVMKNKLCKFEGYAFAWRAYETVLGKVPFWRE